MSACRLAALLLLGLAVLARPAGAEPLVADLTSHVIGITTGFTGTSVVLFGATEGGGDVIVVVRGPARDMVVRRKSRVGAVWVNTHEVTFDEVPSFYAVASSKALDAIITPAARALHQIGLADLRLTPQGHVPPAEATEFRKALVRTQQRAGLFGDRVGKVDFLGDRLFRTTITFPANVPTGTYLVEVFLVRGKEVVSGQTTPLVVSKVGVDAQVYDFAHTRAAEYGVIAVIVAVMAGWLATLPFRTA